MRCYICARELTRDDVNEEGDGLICSSCTTEEEEVVTYLEPGDREKLGIRKVYLR